MKQTELTELLQDLRLPGMLKNYSDRALIAQRENKTYEEYLHMLAEAELDVRETKRIHRLKHDAKLPMLKDLDSYDFKSIKGITIRDINRLLTGDFIRQGSNVVFYGSFGLGKTHMAIGLIQKLCEKSYKCLFMNTSSLIENLIEAKKALQLSVLWKKLDKYDLIVCDELGYIPESKEGADLFFQFISQRYERKSILITTNLAYSEWSKVFLSETTTAAAVDRIIHKCETYSLTGPSKRLADAKKNMDKNKETEMSL